MTDTFASEERDETERSHRESISRNFKDRSLWTVLADILEERGDRTTRPETLRTLAAGTGPPMPYGGWPLPPGWHVRFNRTGADPVTCLAAPYWYQNLIADLREILIEHPLVDSVFVQGSAPWSYGSRSAWEFVRPFAATPHPVTAGPLPDTGREILPFPIARYARPWVWDGTPSRAGTSMHAEHCLCYRESWHAFIDLGQAILRYARSDEPDDYTRTASPTSERAA